MRRVFFHAITAALVTSLLALSGATLTGCGKKDQGGEAAKHEGSAPSGAPGGASASQEPQMIGASHILIAYQGAMRSNATRTREEALARAKEVLEKVRAPGADFGALAVEYSDDPTAQQNRGDLSVFAKGMMVPEFDQAAFRLQVGEVSDVVETPFGFHIIKRTA